MSNIYDKASLVLIPSGTKTSKVYSQIPTNGDGDFTFSRSTAATRVNASGNIEKETQNLLLQSNSFDTTWGSTNTTETGGQSGYDGSSDAWLLSISGGSNSQRVEQTISNSGVQTFSAYAKAGTLNWCALLLTDGTTSQYAFFDLQNGVLGTGINSPIDFTIESVGGGWYRCSVTASLSAVSAKIYPATTDGNTNQSSGNIYIQDAQLEQGLVARDYIETTTAAVEGGITDNVPRLDYTDSSCPALLLEPQRTNLASLSEYFAGWNNQTNVTITSNYTTSPEGLDNASRLLFTANGFIINIGGPSQSSGTQYTLSCYAKRNDNGTQNFGFFKNGSGSVDGAMALTSEWQRFDYTYTASNDSQLGLAGINGADVSVYGFQAEANASYATSYIPTYGTSVTRNADRAEVENGNNVLPTAYPFTLYSEMDVRAIGDEWGASLLNRNINNAYYVIGVNFSKKYSMLARNNTSSSVQSTANATEGTHKICGVFTETTLKLFVDGVLLGSSNNAQSLSSAANDLLLGQLRIASDTQIRNTIHQSLVFNQALTDQEAIDLTTI